MLIPCFQMHPLDVASVFSDEQEKKNLERNLQRGKIVFKLQFKVKKLFISVVVIFIYFYIPFQMEINV